MNEYDVALHLLDRQIVDLDGRLVGKVDDVELTEDGPDLVPTGLMVGSAALAPRFGRRLGPWLRRRYEQVGVSHAARRSPAVVDLELVAEVGSGVHLTVPRAGLLRPRVDSTVGPARHRVGDLLGMPVQEPHGLPAPRRSRVRVLDVRLTRAPGHGDRSVVCSLVVGAGRPGAMLGYDRRRVRGPWLVAATVGWLHRHSRAVAWDAGVEVDWQAREVRIGPGATVTPLVDDLDA